MITSNVLITDAGFDFDPTPTELDTIPILSHCDVDFARLHGGDYVNHVIDQLVDSNMFNMSTVKLNFLCQRFVKGSYSIGPGWHLDWYTHDSHGTINSKKHRVSLLSFGQDVTRTEFYIGELPDEVMCADGLSMEDFWFYRDNLVNDSIQKYGATIETAAPNIIYTMNPHTMHRPTPAVENGTRCLVKIEESDSPARNRILKTTTVYVPFDTMVYQG